MPINKAWTLWKPREITVYCTVTGKRSYAFYQILTRNYGNIFSTDLEQNIDQCWGKRCANVLAPGTLPIIGKPMSRLTHLLNTLLTLTWCVCVCSYNIEVVVSLSAQSIAKLCYFLQNVSLLHKDTIDPWANLEYGTKETSNCVHLTIRCRSLGSCVRHYSQTH